MNRFTLAALLVLAGLAGCTPPKPPSCPPNTPECRPTQPPVVTPTPFPSLQPASK